MRQPVKGKMTTRFIVLLVLSGSIAAQAYAATTALRLIAVTGRRLAWALITMALVLMTVRRLVPFFTMAAAGFTGPVPDLFSESVGLILSVMMAAGIRQIGPIFIDIRRLENTARINAERFRTLFGKFALPIFEFDFSATRAVFEGLRAHGVTTLDPHFIVHPESAGFSLDAVDGLRVNDAAAAIFAAADPADLLVRLKRSPVEGLKRSFGHALEAFWNGAKEFHDEAVLTAFDGSKKEVGITYLVLSDADRDESRLIVTVTDFTARNRAQRALRDSEEKYRQIWESASDLILLYEVDEGGHPTLADHNPSAHRILHTGNGNGTLHLPEEGPPEEGRETISGYLRNSIATSTPASGEAAVMTSAGERLLDSIFVPIANERGRVRRVIAIMRDITERKNADLEIRKLNARLEERVLARTRELAASNKRLASAFSDLKQAQARMTQQEKMASLGQLTAGIAHEINNPLAFVSSNIERFDEYFHTLQGLIGSWRHLIQTLPDRDSHTDLYRSIQEQERNADLDYISENFGLLMNHTKEGAERIKTIVAQLRGFARLADGGFAPADLNAALDECLLFVWNEIKYKATVCRKFGDIPPVECNLGEIKQVIVNLLINASQAIQDQGEITLRTGMNNGRAFIEIADTGVGIPRENLRKIFDPFFTTKPLGKGTGLGLWISTTIVQKHNGTLTAESAPGAGSTFTIGLPIHQQEISVI
jgi:PAS domain S-box-containing protein